MVSARTWYVSSAGESIFIVDDVGIEDASVDAIPSREESDYLMKCINFDSRYPCFVQMSLDAGVIRFMIQPADKQSGSCRLIPKSLWLVVKEVKFALIL